MLHTLLEVMVYEDAATAVKLLRALAGVPRFAMNILCIPAIQKERLRAAWDVAVSTTAGSGLHDELAVMRSVAYGNL
jgi:hypothetical protein